MVNIIDPRSLNNLITGNQRIMPPVHIGLLDKYDWSGILWNESTSLFERVGQRMLYHENWP